MGCGLSSAMCYVIAISLAADPRLEPISVCGNDDRIYSHSVGHYTASTMIPCMGVNLSSVIQCLDPSTSTEPRGSPPWVRVSVALRPCIRLDPGRIRTMKQSFASAARLQGGRTHSHSRHLSQGIKAGSTISDCNRQPLREQAGAETVYSVSCGEGRLGCVQHDALWNFAGGNQSPQFDEELSRECHNHGGLARTAVGPRPVPFGERAIFLKLQEPPR
jgi:hypothetical protein